MGQLLSHPIEDKTIDYHTRQTLAYCVGTMQGYRMSMEDAHDVKVNEDESLAVFGVFDGHGGKQCSEYLSEHLPRAIFRTLNNWHKALVGIPGAKPIELSQYMTSIKNAFFHIDHELSSMPHLLNCGSTGIVTTIIRDRYIIVANTGDSRCILSVDGVPKTLSFDHKPILMNERIRVENSNGYVLNNRINEILALSRAFGDFTFKAPYIDNTKNKYILQNRKYFKHDLVHLPPELFQVTVEPEILVYDLHQTTPEFIVVACDGIWDCYKNTKIVQIIRDKLALGWKLNKIVEFILQDCLMMANNYTGIGFDNMTLIIIAVHSNSNIDEWYEHMKAKVLREKNLL
ncbi:ser/thr protein phosphatase [Suhomyces tanzawaensis NRRL Y-17324]|uniref:protein-serine/threonine phosphatase n=1 Tax=Suhomyces tanzawaensis NRRL Y-17324 TaxID=984487 RepID=A0A1E4SKV1_9ASCO|nr:ser/thr protein phosphatase [Suhomyces tanzawaensis NRRL Y-17324]ODV80123.1 ser/thr protein phosphatase [Suhomyces tanzawaensis NRRL Y-17324]